MPFVIERVYRASHTKTTVLARLRSFRRPSAREAAEFAPVGLAPHGETRAADRSAPLPATSRALLASLARPLVPRSRLPAAMPADSNSRHRATAWRSVLAPRPRLDPSSPLSPSVLSSPRRRSLDRRDRVPFRVNRGCVNREELVCGTKQCWKKNWLEKGWTEQDWDIFLRRRRRRVVRNREIWKNLDEFWMWMRVREMRIFARISTYLERIVEKDWTRRLGKRKTSSSRIVVRKIRGEKYYFWRIKNSKKLPILIIQWNNNNNNNNNIRRIDKIWERIYITSFRDREEEEYYRARNRKYFEKNYGSYEFNRRTRISLP